MKINEVDNGLRYGVFFDVHHRLHYGFRTRATSEVEEIRNSFHKMRTYCKSHRYPCPTHSNFKSGYKSVSREEYENIKREKRSLFKELTS